MEDIVQEPLPRALILAHQYADMMESGKFSTVLELAQYLKSDRSHVARTLSLVNLAPDIVGDTKITRTKSLLCEIFEHRGNKENSKWSERAA